MPQGVLFRPQGPVAVIQVDIVKPPFESTVERSIGDIDQEEPHIPGLPATGTIIINAFIMLSGLPVPGKCIYTFYIGSQAIFIQVKPAAFIARIKW